MFLLLRLLVVDSLSLSSAKLALLYYVFFWSWHNRKIIRPRRFGALIALHSKQATAAAAGVGAGGAAEEAAEAEAEEDAAAVAAA